MPLGKDDPKNGAKGKPGVGKAGVGRNDARGGGLGSKPGSQGKAGGMGGNKPGMGGNKPGMGGGKPGMGGSKPGGAGFGAKPGSSSASKPGGMMGSKSGSGMMGKSAAGGVGGKMGVGAGKPPIGKPGTGIGAKPGVVPGKPGTGIGAKPGVVPGKPGAPGAAKPGMPGAKPGAPGTKPGVAGAKPGTAAAGAKPGALGAKPGVAGAKPGVAGAKPGALGAKPGAVGAKAGAMGAVNGKMGLKAGAVAGKAMSAQNAARTAVALKTSHDVAKGMAPQKSSGSGGGIGLDREVSVRNGGGGVAAVEAGGMSRNIPLSQMDKLDITKMSPRELMMLERQYGAGWLKTLAPTQFNRLQSSGAAAGLTSNVPTALSSHVDPSMLQAASGVTGNSGLMAGQISQNGQISDPNMLLEVDMEQYKPLDAAALAEHPEQIGEGEVTMYNGGEEGEDGEEFDEEYDEEEEEEMKRPSDLMRAKLIDDSLTVEEDGAPRIPSPMATPMLMTSPLITPRAAPSHLTATPQSPLPPPTLLLTAAPIMSCSAPPAEEEEDEFMEEDEEEEEETTIHLAGSPGTPYFTGEPSPYGENLYNQQPGYDPLDDSQYRMAAPLLEKGGDPSAPFPQYKEVHKSYYYFSQNTDPMKYSFSKAVDNYDASAREDGTYCYSCVMFCGVLMIGAGIIMIIVELFGLFGNKEHMPMALGGAGVLAFGILVLAGAMLLWRRKRSNMKKNAVRV